MAAESRNAALERGVGVAAQPGASAADVEVAAAGARRSPPPQPKNSTRSWTLTSRPDK